MTAQKYTAPSGPLAGLRVVEFAAIGPVPYACMLLADMGAEVVTVERPGVPPTDARDITLRGRTIVAADLKRASDRDLVASLVERSDVLIEGFRPGVMERLGLCPKRFNSVNPRLVYTRVTGWGQDGPWAFRAGHDIDYLGVAGALHPIGPAAGPPAIPLNLLGDYAAGSLFAVTGILAALHERERSSRGQVVDAAIVDGLVSLMTTHRSMLQRGVATEARGSNLLDGGAPHYNVYETADGHYLAVGALEPKFLDKLVELTGLPAGWTATVEDSALWPGMRRELEKIFRGKTRAAWLDLFGSEDVCVAPVLTSEEAALHPQMQARAAVTHAMGAWHTAPAPRFSRSVSNLRRTRAAGLADALRAWNSAPEVESG